MFDLTTIERRHEMIDELEIGEEDKETLHDALDSAAAKVAVFQCTYDLRTIDSKHEMIEKLPRTSEADKEKFHDALDLTAGKVAAMQGTFCSDNVERNTRRIQALPIEEAEKKDLMGKMEKTRQICTATKAGAAMLAAAATTPEEHLVAGAAMAKVANHHEHRLDVPPEEAHASRLFEQLQDVLPAFSVRKATPGTTWFDTKPPEERDRVCLRRWQAALGLTEVTSRLNFLHGQQNMPWSPLITPFRDALIAMACARAKRDREIPDATDHQPTAGGSISAPKKSRASARCFTADEKLELESLLTTGKLTSLLSRETEALRMSAKSGNNLTLAQVSNWMNHHKHASKKKR